MRVVADTNILISGLLWHGAPRQLVDAAQAGVIQLVTSQVLIDELARVAKRGKFQRRLATLEMTAADLIAAYAEKATCVVPAASRRPSCATPMMTRCSPQHSAARRN